MTFADESVTLKSGGSEEISAGHTVAYIGEYAMAMDGWGIALHYADIVEHRGFIQELAVGIEFGVLSGNFKSQLRDHL